MNTLFRLLHGVLDFSQERVKELVSHPYRTLITVLPSVTVIFESVYWLVTGPVSPRDVVLFTVRVLVLGIFILFPQIGAFLVVGLQILELFIPNISPMTMLLACLLAVGLLSYINVRQGVLLGTMLGISAFVSAGLFSGSVMNNGGSISYSCLVIIAIGTSIILRLDSRRKEETQQNKALLSNTRIARHLHDYTTNDLSNIIMIADKELNSNEQVDSKQVLASILHTANDALSQTRHVIQALEQPLNPSESEKQRELTEAISEDFTHDVLELVDEQQEILTSLGFEGTILVPNHEADAITHEEATLVLGLMRELFGNIAKHSDPNYGYTMTISFIPQAFDISLSDIPRIKASCKPNGLQSGMLRYQKAVEDRNGNWSIDSTETSWNLTMHIPHSPHA